VRDPVEPPRGVMNILDPDHPDDDNARASATSAAGIVRQDELMSSAIAQPQPTYAALLRRHRYPRFAITVFVARASGTMFNTAGVLLVLSRTGSPALAGVTMAAAVLPGAISGPVFGAYVDVASHRRVLIVLDQLLSVAGLVGLLLLAGHAPEWTLPAVAVLYSVTRPLSAGSFFSAMAEIVGPDLLGLASKIEATSLNLSFVLGPGLAGAIAGASSATVAIEVQVVMTALAALLIAINPAFEARAQEQAETVGHAVREGLTALRHNQFLFATGIAATLAAFGWGLMTIGFPLYAAQTLHAGAHAGGYMWAAMALGSIVGTFVLRGEPSLQRVGVSYGILGLSALLWPLAHSLLPGILLIGLTGFLEGPAYSGTITLRQRHMPAAVRGQVTMTLTGAALTASAFASAICGAVHLLLPAIIAFTAINLIAAAVTIRRRGLA
jgi:MFS family permease